MRRVIRWGAAIVALFIVLCIVVLLWISATESGTRWLFARATPLLPPALQIDEIEGTLLEGVGFRSLSWSDETVQVSVGRLDTQFELLSLLSRTMRINQLEVQNVNVLVNERGPAEPPRAPFSLDLPLTLLLESAAISEIIVAVDGREFAVDRVLLSGRLSGSALSITQLDVQSSLADINLSGNGRLTGNYPADAVGAWELRLPDQPAFSGIVRLSGDATAYELEHDLLTPYEIHSTGALRLVDSDVAVDLSNAWERLTIEANDARTVTVTEGVLRVVGTSSNLEFLGDTTLLSGNIPAFAVTTRGRYQNDRVDFESISFANDWGRLLATGEVILSPYPSWSLDYELSALDPSFIEKKLSGELSAAGKASGKAVNQQVAADVEIHTLSGDMNGFPIDGSAVLKYADETMQVQNGVISVGDNRVDLNASIGQQSQVNAVLSLAALSQLGLDATGMLNGDVSLMIDGGHLAGSGKFIGEDLGWANYIVDRLSVEFDLPSSDAADGSVQLEYEAKQVQGEVRLDSRFAENRWSGSVRQFTVRGERLGEWDLQSTSEFSVSDSAFQISSTCLTNLSIDSIACASANFDFTGPLQFDVSLEELPMTALPIHVPEGASVTGAINAHARGKYVGQQLTANAELNVRNLELTADFEGDEVSVDFERAFAQASIIDNRLDGLLEVRLRGQADQLGGTAEIADIFEPQSPLRFSGELELNDLGLFSFFYPDLTNVAGRIAGSIDVRGSLAAPELVGEIGLKGGSFGVRRAGISVTDVDISLSQSEPGRLALRGGARSGEGYVDIRGDTALGASSGISTRITLSGENFALAQLPDWQLAASPSIDVLLDERATRVSGEIGIPSASISVHTVPESAERPSPDVVVHGGAEEAVTRTRQLHVDVTTTLGEAVSFSGFGLTTSLRGGLRIVGSSNKPFVSSGRVVLNEGRYKAYGQTLEIERGELIFNGPLGNPTLNIRATRKANDDTIAGIHLTGTPAQLRSEVYSEPALGDAEALSYLLTGRPLSNADSEQGDMLNQAAFALGLATAGGIASRIRGELGLDTLGIQGGSENRQLVAGKRIGDRLLIEYAYGVIDNLGTLLLRYQLNSRLVIESRSGSVRNVDIVYSVKKK